MAKTTTVTQEKEAARTASTMSWVWTVSSSSSVASGFCRYQMTASATSRRLCGGMLVAIPTAIPAEPFTRRFGKRAGRTVGSCREPS